MDLQEAASETDTQLITITVICTIRWDASSFRAVSAVWRNYSALFLMIQSAAATDCKWSSADRAKYRGIAAKLSSVSFLFDLALMKDVLRELSIQLVLEAAITIGHSSIYSIQLWWYWWNNPCVGRHEDVWRRQIRRSYKNGMFVWKCRWTNF